VPGVAALEVRKDDLRATRMVDEALPELGHGEVRLQIPKFGFTANNVTYAAMGDVVGYWKMFPDLGEGWGRIPVWGYGDVAASRVDGLREGERYYGYFPMSSHLTVEPEVGGAGFVDVAGHRRELPAVYNRYLRVTPDEPFEDEVMILRPLFSTGFLLAEHVKGAERVIVSSASSKTGYSLAFLLAERGTSSVGLTSQRNRDFTEGLGLYDEVITYDALERLSGAGVYVDLAGDAAVTRAVHERVRLSASIQVGLTHWEGARPAGDLPGPAPEFFFGPTHIERLSAELGPQGLQRRLGGALAAFVERLDWLELDRGSNAQDAFRAFVDGTADPRKGYVLSLP
jgi:hypothetical protein